MLEAVTADPYTMAIALFALPPMAARKVFRLGDCHRFWLRETG